MCLEAYLENVTGESIRDLPSEFDEDIKNFSRLLEKARDETDRKNMLVGIALSYFTGMARTHLKIKDQIRNNFSSILIPSNN